MNQSHKGIVYKASHEITLDMPYSDRLIRLVLLSHPIRSKLTNHHTTYYDMFCYSWHQFHVLMLQFLIGSLSFLSGFCNCSGYCFKTLTQQQTSMLTTPKDIVLMFHTRKKCIMNLLLIKSQDNNDDDVDFEIFYSQ